MSDDREREDLEALTKAPGWLRFKLAQEKHWEAEFANFVRIAVGDSSDAVALMKLRQVIVAKDAVLKALTYPEERLRQLQDAAVTYALQQHGSLSRRGTL